MSWVSGFPGLASRDLVSAMKETHGFSIAILPVEMLSFSPSMVTSHPISKAWIGTSRTETAPGELSVTVTLFLDSGKRLTVVVREQCRLRVTVGPRPPTKCLEHVLVWWFGRQELSLLTAFIKGNRQT